MTRRALGRAAVALGAPTVTAVLAGCGVQQGSGPAAGGSATGSVSWMYSANPQTSGFDRIEEAFKQKYPNIRLEALYTSSGYDDKLLASYSAGTPPDVLRLNDDYVLGYKVKNLIAPLDTYVKSAGIRRDDYFAAVYDFPIQDGKHYAWFLGANPRLIFYNVDLFKKEGVKLPPAKWERSGWTWEDFVDTARRLTKVDPRSGQGTYGASVYDDTGNEQTFSINNGSPTGIYSKDGRKFTLADPPGYEAIQWIADLTHKQRVQPTRQVASELKGADDMFVNGQLAMWWNNTGTILRLRRDAQFTFDVAPVPMKAKRLTESSVQTYALAVGAKNPDNGWRLLNFFTEQEVGRIFIDNGYVIPAKKSFSKDYVAANKGKHPANMELIVDSFNYQTQPNQTLDTQGARNVYRGKNLEEIWDGVVTAREGLTRVRAQVEAVIAPK
ncbi:MAG TPA: sugar ABC transporter substrate-binding protein [Chloroflexota bacterium]|nr:sugar ABC transporter substrate-binding protein [Chloroflexota bacterium]